METELSEIKVTLSRDQKEEIFMAFIKKEIIVISLDDNNLTGEDTLLVPEKSFKWDINRLISDKETFHEFTERQEAKCLLTEDTYSELLNNGFYLVPSMNDEGLKKFRLYTPPTINDKLEEARRKNESIFIILDYSLLSTKSIEYSVFENLRKLV